MDMITVNGLTKRYGEKTVVDNVSFEVAVGGDIRSTRSQRRRQDDHSGDHRGVEAT